MTLEKAFSVDRKKALIQMCADGEPLAHMICDGEFLEREIRDLARFRANIVEPVPNEPQPNQHLEVVRSPSWAVPHTHSGPKGHVMMGLRHPGYGWVGFMLEPDRARALAAALIEQADAKSEKKKKEDKT
jgi:hypothetical protein